MEGDQYNNNDGGRVCEEVLLPNGIADCDIEPEANIMTLHRKEEEEDAAAANMVYYEEDPMGGTEQVAQDGRSAEAARGEEDGEDEEDPDDLVEEADEEPEEGDEEEPRPETKQVPKKRKDAALLAETDGEGEAEVDEEEGEGDGEGDNEGDGDGEGEGDNEGDNDEEEEYADSQDGGEEPSSSAATQRRRENTVDEDQCRVCTTKEDLVSLFRFMETKTVAELLMSICPSVSIALKDFMPQYICNTCLDHVTIAVQLKNQCESTERELRKKLSRHKNKVRRPTGYVIIDAPNDPSEPSEEDEPKDDCEFKVSDEATVSFDDDSEDSDFSAKRRRLKGPGRGRGRGRPLSSYSMQVTKPPPGKTPKRVGRPPGKKYSAPAPAVASSGDEEDDTKRRRVDNGGGGVAGGELFSCDQCEATFPRKLSLVLHRKSHGIGRSPINCEVCGKQFKILGAYRTHLERHKTNFSRHDCGQCDQWFATKGELKRHLMEVHDTGVAHQCVGCRRKFVSAARLARHCEGHCRGGGGKKPAAEYDVATGKDLFKAVAPLTTTYWSDSFSD